MIEEILPPAVAAAESCHNAPDSTLFPEEAALVVRAVDKRRDEFTTGRWCARRALAALGVPPVPILTGERGAPRWPTGIVGTITHCAGYRAAAVARVTDLASIGIDAEPHERLPDGVISAIALPEEVGHLAGLAAAVPGVHWDRLLFCAKEAVYKAWYPLTGRWLGFEGARVTVPDPVAPDGRRAAGTFTARLVTPATALDGRPLTGFTGRWLVSDGLILTSVAVDA